MKSSTRNRFPTEGETFIDLGNDPPLLLTDEDEGERGPVLRAVSWRWMAGTVLTGVTSILLMGTALTAALNNPNQFASLPDSIAALAATGDEALGGGKSDRIRQTEERVSSRQILQVSTVTRQGERDFIRLRPFVRINATLSARQGDLASEVPKYDAMRLFADTSEPEAPREAGAEAVVAGADDQLYGATVDGEVAVRVSPFPVDRPDLEPTANFSTAEVEQMVRFQMASDPANGLGSAALAFADGSPFQDVEAYQDSASALGVSIIPENLSTIAKSDSDNAGGLSEAVVTAAKGQDLGEILKTSDVTDGESTQIVAALSRLADVDGLDASRRIRIGYEPDPHSDSGIRTVRVSIYRDGAHQATVARSDAGVFVRADEPSSLLAVVADTEAKPEPKASGATLYQAVFETALEQEVPTPLIDQLIRIFAYDVDFQARASASDGIEIFHSLPDKDDVAAGEPEILYAALTHDGVAKRFYRFRTPDDGVVDYYDEEGKSAKKFLMRKPVTDGVLRSRFGMRRHPILGVMRLHAGIDYAAKRGTPILAAGNGVVSTLKRSSSYGNYTVIRHTNGYETSYAHQTRFAKGMKVGARVRQGQVIGYVGSTGLSTGPHLHFEIRVNGKPVDPLRIRLPRGRVLQGELLTSFERERQRIDKLLGIETPTQLAANN